MFSKAHAVLISPSHGTFVHTPERNVGPRKPSSSEYANGVEGTSQRVRSKWQNALSRLSL